MKNIPLSLLSAGLISTTAIAEDICIGAYQAQNYPQAAECYVNQLKKEHTFKNLLGSGTSYYKLGHYQEALTYLKEAEKKAINTDDFIEVYSWLGISHHLLGNSKEELAYDMKFLDLNLKSGNRKEIGKAYNNLGGYYLNQNQPQKALEYYKKALEYKEKSECAATYGGMSLAYEKLGNIPKAEEMHQKVIKIDEQTGDYHSLANHKCNFGIFYFNLGRYTEARTALEEALAISRNTNQIDQESHALTALSVIDYQEKKIISARDKASEALRLAKQSGNTTIINQAKDVWSFVNGN